MINSRVLIALMFLVGCSLPANAYWLNGNELLDECKEQSWRCLGVLTGIADALADDRGYAKPQFQVCLPLKTRPDQLLDVVMNELQAHPEKRTEPAVDIVARALVRAFPCP